MGKTNKEWHQAHRMPRNASDAQRMQWHIEHSQNCSCRPIPDGVRRLIEESESQSKEDQT